MRSLGPEEIILADRDPAGIVCEVQIQRASQGRGSAPSVYAFQSSFFEPSCFLRMGLYAVKNEFVYLRKKLVWLEERRLQIAQRSPIESPFPLIEKMQMVSILEAVHFGRDLSEETFLLAPHIRTTVSCRRCSIQTPHLVWITSFSIRYALVSSSVFSQSPFSL